MSDDQIPPGLMTLHCRAILDAIGDTVPRRAAALVSADGPPWVATQDELAQHLAEAGSHRVARRLRRAHVPPGSIALVIVEADVRVQVVRLDDEGAEAAEEEHEVRGASALSVLGRLAGGAR